MRVFSSLIFCYMSVVLLFFPAAVYCACTPESGARQFYMFYQLPYQPEQQEMRRLLSPATPIKIAYEHTYGLKHHVPSQGVPNDRAIRRNALEIKEKTPLGAAKVAILDIETWPIDLSVSDDLAKKSADKVVDLIKRTREIIPEYMIGNYGFPVPRDRKASAQGPGKARYEAWQSRALSMQFLADELDVFFPSLYSFEKDRVDQWVNQYAVPHLGLARKLARKDQPVIAFLWPQYHDRSRYKGQFVSYSFWLTQLKTVFKYADGVLIWSNHKGSLDSKAGWFRATRDFIGFLKEQCAEINPT